MDGSTSPEDECQHHYTFGAQGWIWCSSCAAMLYEDIDTQPMPIIDVITDGF